LCGKNLLFPTVLDKFKDVRIRDFLVECGYYVSVVLAASNHSVQNSQIGYSSTVIFTESLYLSGIVADNCEDLVKKSDTASGLSP
jgi:hypothetical protein